jgi:DNA repair protein SbcD/Mre11
MPLKLLHLADLHLDRPFVGLPIEQARARRRGLREALERSLALAGARRVEAITIGGDLWEHEHVLPDTCRWVADRLAGAGVPVVLVAGNHDPLRPGGPYERVAWPANVHVLGVGALHEQRLGDLSVWGCSWGGEPLRATALERFHVPRDGRSHCLLLHGTLVGSGGGDRGHCPFTAQSVRAAGFDLCLAGHLHGGGLREGLVLYPGSPEPLAWDETGRHAVALVELDPGAPPEIELIDVNTTRTAQIEVECDGAASSADIERALSAAIQREGASAPDRSRPDRTSEGTAPNRSARLERLWIRAMLRGRIASDCRLEVSDLTSAAGGGVGFLELHDHTSRAFETEILGAQESVLGRFVTELRAQIDECGPSEHERRARLELALELGLRAMHGDDLELASAELVRA